MASRFIISAAHCFFYTDDNKVVTRILTAEDIKLWIGDHNLFISGETFIPEKQIRKIRRDQFCPILMSFLLVVLPSLPTILTMPLNKWGKCTLVGLSIFQFWS